ncbi:unhealthy ribosome biogenesis protein 2 homolog [Mizuhopecten yessoensis]|uniref:unhealthy ribosome biogenesis protein 2 homolog n=1 Tax=Mizuhopecten yessoensis TaxID=6573 RepID=UPI000B457E70|nr:unhealthy ribosome biogenesis protein 2 homolog [Mizuhopecten yessoensis]
MAALYAGLYLRLKARDGSIRDKVKLTLFAWKSERAFIPNKEQVLIDFLCGLLVNKKKNKVSDEDSVLVLKCLYDILHTKKAHQPSKYGKTIIIKPSICQVLISSLTDPKVNSDSDVLKLVIGCSYAIIHSQCLSYVFTTKYEHMAGLLSALVQVTVRRVTTGRELSTELIDLLKKVINIYKGSQRAHPNQKQVLQAVTSKLLVPAVMLWGSTRSDTTEVEQIGKELINIIQNGIFDKDHQVSFNMYLSIVCGEGESMSFFLRSIENLFTTISSILNGKNSLRLTSDKDMKLFTLDYLPYFFNGFIHHKCNSDNITAHRLFLYICSLIGIKLDDSDPCEQALEPSLLKVITGLLRMVHEADIYHVANDNAAGGQQLQAYKTVLDIILRSSRCPEVFECFQQLLYLNHMILEPRITEVFSLCLLNQSQQCDASDKLLKDLISTYGKLRQVPKWIEKLLVTVEQANLTAWSGFPTIFSQRFGEVVQSLPQGATVDIWESLLKVISNKYLPQLASDSGAREGQLVCIADLLQMYLKNVRIADYSITDLTSAKVNQLMKTMATDVLVPSLDLCLEKKNSSALPLGTLLLCGVWGELEMMLGQYTQHQAAFQQVSLADHQVDSVSPVILHTYWSAGKWTKLQKSINKSKHMDVNYCWDLLIHQVLRVTLLSVTLSSPDLSPLLNKVLDSLFTVSVENNSGQSWDGTVFSVNEQNYSTAKWSLLETSLPLITKCLADRHVKTIADFIVQLYLTDSVPSERICMKSTGDRVMEGHVLSQNREIQSSILTTIWKSISVALQPDVKVGKKRKGNLLVVHQLLGDLGDSDQVWTQEMDSTKLEFLQDITTRVGALLTSDSGLVVSPSVVCAVGRMLQLLSLLPIESLNASDQHRCILGLTVILHTLRGAVGTDDTYVIEKCYGLMAVTMEAGHTPLFQMLDLVIYMDWLDGLYTQSQVYTSLEMKMRLLLEVSCKTVVMDYRVLPKLTAYSNKMEEKIADFQKKKIVDTTSMDGCMIMASCCLSHLEKLLSKSFLPPSVREICETCLLHLIRVTIKFVTSAKADPSQLPLAAVSCYATTLKCCSFGEEATDVERTVQDSFGIMLKWSMEVLQQEDASPESQSEALNLLSVICCSHGKQTELFTSDHKAQVWHILMSLFKRVLASQKTTVAMETKPAEASLPDWRVHKRILLYNGQLTEHHWTPVILTQLQETVAALVPSCETDQFQTMINSLLNQTGIQFVGAGTQQLTSTLYIWQQLLNFDLSPDQSKVLVHAVKNLMLNCVSLMQHIHGSGDERLVSSVAVPLLTTQVKMLEFGSKLMSSHTASLALHCCQFTPLDGSTSFVPAFHAVYKVLNALLVHNTNTVYGVIPSFLSCTKRLLKVIVNRSDQEKIGQDQDVLAKLIDCALLFDRLCQLISTHKRDFNKVAGYLVSDYVCEVQKVTLHPDIKKTLVPAVYKLLDLCDRFSISQLHTVLQTGVKEVFKVLYDDYTKYFKYNDNS